MAVILYPRLRIRVFSRRRKEDIERITIDEMIVQEQEKQGRL